MASLAPKSAICDAVSLSCAAAKRSLLTDGFGSDLVSYVEVYYSRIVAVAVTRRGLSGKRIGEVRAWNGVDGPLKCLSDSATSDLEVIL